MDLGVAGRTALVTGASTGIGRATAIALAREGVRVIVTARSMEALAPLAEAMQADGLAEPVRLVADFSQPGEATALARAALEAAGDRIDILINNAGGSRPLERPDDDAVWQESLLFNFISVRKVTEHLVPAMVDRGWGRVVSVSGALIAKSANAAAPAKAALESWSKGCAAHYAARGLTFNCVAPGRIDTAQIRNRLHPTEASRRDFIERNIPAGRFGEPDEAAAVILFLASARASYVNGVTVPVDGGALRFAF